MNVNLRKETPTQPLLTEKPRRSSVPVARANAQPELLTETYVNTMAGLIDKYLTLWGRSLSYSNYTIVLILVIGVTLICLRMAASIDLDKPHAIWRAGELIALWLSSALTVVSVGRGLRLLANRFKR